MVVLVIEGISIRGWQSLVSLDLDLARFTVIVGPSSSGKSALIRAFKAVASNVPGTGHITRGAKTAALTVRTAEHVITLEHNRGAWLYRLTDAEGEEEFTKLNRAVPEAVTRALRIAPVPSGGFSINFAGQFDPPYLLRESGAAVARVLGELTNVDRIFEAVREANRRKSGFASTLRTRQSDLVELTARAKDFADLPAQLRAMARAEKAAEQAAQLADRVARLKAATELLATAESVLARSSVLPEVPTDSRVLDAQERLDGFRALVRDWASANNTLTTASREVDKWTQAETELHDELHQVLTSAGTCPTCERPM